MTKSRANRRAILVKQLIVIHGGDTTLSTVRDLLTDIAKYKTFKNLCIIYGENTTLKEALYWILKNE